MTDTTAADAALEAYLDATHDARLESLQGVPAHPEHLGAARARRRLPRAPPSGWPSALTEAGLEHVEVVGDGRPSGRLRRLAPRRGRPDGHRLRPLRRPAGRPARPVDLAAVRAGRRRRPDARPRRGRRQGPDPRRTSWPPARRAGDARPLPGQPQVRLRGRGGVRARSTSTPGSRPTATASRPTSRSSATRASSRATCRPSRSACAGMMYAQIDVVGTAVDLHSGGFGGAVQNPANALAQIIAGAQGPGRADPDPGLLRRRRAADRRGARRDRGAAVRRGGLPRRARRCRRSSARPASRPSSGAAPGRPSTSTASGAASRARAPRRSSRPTPTPRSAAGSSPTQDPDRIFERVQGLRRARSRRPA